MMMNNYLADLTCLILLLPTVHIWYQTKNKYHTTVSHLLAFTASIFTLLLWLSAWANFRPDLVEFQHRSHLSLIPTSEFTFGVDGLSITLILLTVFIMPICFLAATSVKDYVKEFLTCLLVTELFLILSFYSTNVFGFYVCFESTLIPMFLMIGIWGSRDRKIKAAYYLFLYTLFGSLFMLYGILYLSNIVGTTDFEVLQHQEFSRQTHLLLFVLFFIPFAVKIPMLPFHVWLPEAHVEAPTIGSVILASLVLKLGSFGFLRYTIPLFWYGVSHFAIIVDALAIMSVIYASLATIRQVDLKRVIAYSSIAHMNLIVLGLFSLNKQGIAGATYLMIGHGVVSSGLFFCVGVLYDRYHTRLIRYYGGLATVMPWFALYFLIFTLANMSFPGTANFIGEFLIFVGLFSRSPLVTVLAGSGIVLSAVYSIWVYNRTVFGTTKTDYITKYTDLTPTEFLILSSLAAFTVLLGVYAQPILDYLEIISNIKF